MISHHSQKLWKEKHDQVGQEFLDEALALIDKKEGGLVDEVERVKGIPIILSARNEVEEHGKNV